ncbi:MAG: ADP-ribosylation factor-like protein [Promethearchaeota archaeon]
MLYQIYIVKDKIFLYEVYFKRVISKDEFNNLIEKLKEAALSKLKNVIGVYNDYKNKYKISYLTEKDLNLYFFFINGLSDKIEDIRKELYKLKKEFLNFFRDKLNDYIDPSLIELINPITYSIHRNLKPKISLVGFGGVGKTTTVKLIKKEEIPAVHIPTRSGEVSTIKIGKLYFQLWDFAGQEQFSYLWNSFIKGSDAILIISDSSLENVEKSKFFIELIKDEAPHARSVVIGNKQDLPDALSADKIEQILGLKTYSMVAIDPANRNKIIHIIIDLLEMSSDTSPLIRSLFERDQLMKEANEALENRNLLQALNLFEKVSDLCLELGDDYLYKECYKKIEKIKIILDK